MTIAQAPTQDMIALAGYWETKDILNSPDFVQAGKSESHDFVGETILTLNGDEHFERRRLLSRLMRRSTLERFESDVLEPTIQRCLHDVWETSSPGLPETDLVLLGRKIFLQLAAATVGLDRVDTQEETERLAGYLYPLIEGTTVEWSTDDHQQVLRRGLAAKVSFVQDFVEPAWSRRRALVAEVLAGERPDAELPVDLLTLMSVHCSSLPVELVHREAVLFLVASTLNNAATVTHTVDELAQWTPSHPWALPRLTDSEFLNRVIGEVLRFRAVTPALIRRATRPTSLKSSGRSVESGATFALDIGRANRDPAAWGPDADCFNPERQVPSGEKTYGLAFGAGTHICLGRPLVLGTYTDAEGAGMLARVLRALYTAGVKPSPGQAVSNAPTAQMRFASYPVTFDTLDRYPAATSIGEG